MNEFTGNFADQTAKAMGEDVQENVVGFVADERKRNEFWRWFYTLPKKGQKEVRRVFNQTLDLVSKRSISIVRIPGHVTFDQEENYRQALYFSIKKRDISIKFQFGDIVILNSGHQGFSIKIDN